MSICEDPKNLDLVDLNTGLIELKGTLGMCLRSKG